MVHYLPSCHSTNEIAHNLLKGPIEEGTLVITDHQFEGKGQRGSVWQADPFVNLTFSLILKPEFLSARQQFGLTMAVSLSIKHMLDQHLPGETLIKWPNDIVFRQKKIAGILMENTLQGHWLQTVVVGIGLNVNQMEFRDIQATSMKLATGNHFDLNDILNELVTAISEEYANLKNGTLGQISKHYHESLFGIGEKRRFKSRNEFMGTILGTDQTGRLIIATEEGKRVFHNKEISFLS
jgi:BirA family biotin operon repressor/biotin-[acetyl-CoA-carboxylase] ligase